MSKTSEGVVISSLQRELGQLQEAISHLYPLPKQARAQFISDIQKSVGSLDDPNLPLSLKPILYQLLEGCTAYFEQGNEAEFMSLCQKAIDICGLGWNHLSYWVCTEQNLCYTLFWSLKVSLEKHQKQISMYQGSQNDGTPLAQFFRISTLEAR
jgi:hypothetical protein